MLNIRLMSEADIAVGMRLKAQAGWNQLDGDWRRFLDMQSDGCFLAELDGVPVGTTGVCVFGPIAWIAMVLVDAQLRGKGIGRALMEHALAFADRQGVRTVRLDATPMGQPLYEKLGFVAEYTLSRYGGAMQAVAGAPFERVTAAQRTDFESIFHLDQAVSDTDRRKLISRLLAERPEEARVVRQGDKLAGYLTVRPGCNALQIGPCMASAESGPLLLADAAARYAGRSVFIDIPQQNRAAASFAEQAGLTVQRPLVRMTRGPRINEDMSRLWASSGPELG